MHLTQRSVLDDFVRLVEAMRNAQREYFSSRNHAWLTKAKGLEARVDREVTALKIGVAQRGPSQQSLRFDEEVGS